MERKSDQFAASLNLPKLNLIFDIFTVYALDVYVRIQKRMQKSSNTYDVGHNHTYSIYNQI